VLLKDKLYQDIKMTKKPSYSELESRVKELEALVSKEKDAERELIENNAILMEVQRVSRIGSWLFDPVTGIVSWSDEMYTIFGRNPKSGPPSYDETRNIIHPDDWESFDRAVNKALSDGIYYSLELRLIMPSGDIRYITTRGHVEKDKYGTVKRLIGTTQDITEARKAQDALIKSEERYRALFDNIPVNTVVVDREGRITAFKFPEHADQIVIPGIGDVMYKDFAQYPLIDMYKELMESIGSGRKKEYLDLKYGDNSLHIRISPYKDGAIITAIDTTPIRKLESELQQSRKMESLGTLAGGIAHEINNILGIIMGNAELAMEYIPHNNPASACIKEIRDASDRAKEVVRQVMSFAHRTHADRKPILIRSVIRDSLRLLNSTIPKNIKINEKIICNSEVILGNKTEIGQIMMNLFKNAEQAIKGGIGEIEVSLEPVRLDEKRATQYENLAPGRYARLAIKDTGEGIDPKIMDRIFEPYFTTKDVDEGLGMGLAVVYGIIKKHDGSIKIESDVGRGTIVEMLFPLSDSKAGERESGDEMLPKGTEHILFVDDESSLVRLAGSVLEQQGYRVTGISSSTDALKLFRKDPDIYDLIITDMSMPEMSGDMLIREVRKIRSNIPVILSSGHSDYIDREAVRDISVNAYAMKPLKRAELIKTVRNVLDKALG
jgi:signal transduction histidine kinase/CheY-like chemotaxis protein